MDDHDKPNDDHSGHHDHEDRPPTDHDRSTTNADDRVEQSLLEEEADADEATEHVEHHGGHNGGEHDHGHGGMHEGHEQMFRRRFFVSTLLSIPVLLYSEALQEWLGFSVPAFPGSELINPVFAVIVFAYGGVPFLRMAIPELRDRSPGMMTLISMAITVAFVYSLASVVFPTQSAFFWELVTLIDIMLLGHWIEMRSVRRASSALDELAKLIPDTAERITESGETEEVPVNELNDGDLVLVRPGANVPADGVVDEGDSDVDEAMITGESRPVSKEPGDEVVGGTINGDGSLRVRITATGDDTALAGIMRLVEEAQQSRSKTQMLADRAAGWLFYVAVASAVVTTVAWTVATSFGAPVIERAVTVLVIACPHALGLAIPLVVAINTSLAARNGMLVRDRIAMEQARDLDTVVFDKTGTLTEGEQGVVEIEAVGDVTQNEALALAAAVEGDSEHMIAEAIREASAERGVTPQNATGFEAIKGRGVRATVDGEMVYVGGPNLLSQLDSEVPPELTTFADRAGENARTVVYLVRNDEPVAAFALADVIREESYQVVDALHELGIEVAMLTGDSEDVARAVAEELGIDTVFAEVLPEDKDKKVSELQEQGKLVAMVGDGVNDAPALTRADIGIAIGSGTDVAVQSADIILVQNNPLDVVRLVKISRASYRKMQENLVWAAGYNIFAIPLAAGVLAPIGILLSPAVGALLMSLSTVIVAINAQFLRRVDLDLPSLPGVARSGSPRATD
ncbi:Cu2+-exporting ATPase [Halopelagius inordinatus]|uniref:Cu2+-exporting ATPase n=1 Tax=Halopelagius inordinatus TaxID=553467 RepID=A0A1I2R2L7_9EURY|nr:Cu2+-exporting ATPase [Halopelagius inordinatus]